MKNTRPPGFSHCEFTGLRLKSQASAFGPVLVLSPMPIVLIKLQRLSSITWKKKKPVYFENIYFLQDLLTSRSVSVYQPVFCIVFRKIFLSMNTETCFWPGLPKTCPLAHTLWFGLWFELQGNLLQTIVLLFAEVLYTGICRPEASVVRVQSLDSARTIAVLCFNLNNKCIYQAMHHFIVLTWCYSQ